MEVASITKGEILVLSLQIVYVHVYLLICCIMYYVITKQLLPAKTGSIEDWKAASGFGYILLSVMIWTIQVELPFKFQLSFPVTSYTKGTGG